MSDTEPEEKRRVAWKHFDFEWQTALDLEALFRAVEPTPELRAQGLPPAWGENPPDTLDTRLLHWGWTIRDAYGRYRDGDRPVAFGVYWDYTRFEDDTILMERIAPFVAGDSKLIFAVEEGEFRMEGKLQGWDFDGFTVRLRDAEEIKTYEWTP